MNTYVRKGCLVANSRAKGRGACLEAKEFGGQHDCFGGGTTTRLCPKKEKGQEKVEKKNEKKTYSEKKGGGRGRGAPIIHPGEPKERGMGTHCYSSGSPERIGGEEKV